MRPNNIMKKLFLALMIVIFVIPSGYQSAMAAEKLSKKDFVAKYDNLTETFNLFKSLNR